MSFARAFAAATLLDDGRVLIVGGVNNSGLPAPAEIFDPASKSFSIVGSLNTPRFAPRVTLLNSGQVLVTGGSTCNTGCPTRLAELYNPNNIVVDLSNYTLTDTLTNPTQWRIPLGTTIAPRGFLLVWADGETSQNGPQSSDLHANFKLSKSGEAIALFAPNGQVVDAVVFGAQTTDVSQGRWPNGAPEPSTARSTSPTVISSGGRVRW